MKVKQLQVFARFTKISEIKQLKQFFKAIKVNDPQFKKSIYIKELILADLLRRGAEKTMAIDVTPQQNLKSVVEQISEIVANKVQNIVLDEMRRLIELIRESIENNKIFVDPKPTMQQQTNPPF